MTELKPCPFCGSKAITQVNFRYHDLIKTELEVKVRCSKCSTDKSKIINICGKSFDEFESYFKAVIEAWNRRVNNGCFN